MKKSFIIASAWMTCAALFCACSSDEPAPVPEPDQESTGLFVINQGNFQYGNSTLTYYDPETDVAEQEVFYRANGFKLGDLGQSMTIGDNNTGWIVVNNSSVIFAIDLDTFKEKGRIAGGIISPRYIHFVSDEKAYVSQLYDNRIAIVNPKTYKVTGYITVPDMDAANGSTEMMVQAGDYVYVNCWSYNNRIIRINPATDTVEGSVTTGKQPKAMTLDADGNIWAVTDGGYYGSDYGFENPTLLKLNTSTFTIDLTLEMELGANVGSITTDGSGKQLYWICNDVYSMPITSTTLPSEPLISSGGNWLNGLTVDPERGDVYVADALDYQQSGRLLRYSARGEYITSVPTGVIPGNFCWKTGR